MKINYDSIIDEEKLFNQNQVDGSIPVRPPVDKLNIVTVMFLPLFI